MNYKGYEIDNAFINPDGEINWKNTGNGLFIIGSRNGKEYFIKKNKLVKKPTINIKSDHLFAQMNESALFAESKQLKLRALMKGLTFDVDHIAIEEDNFWDEKDLHLVTITRYLRGAVNSKDFFVKESKSVKQQLFIDMITLISKLHQHGVVHGDLKIPNFLFKKNSKGQYDAYLIDFDSSYPANEVPNFEKMVYSPGYESPEIVFYLDGNEEVKQYMSGKTDIFSLGLIFHEIWTGKLPQSPLDKLSVGIALAKSGENTPIFSDSLDVIIGSNYGCTFMSLINWMLERDPEIRPTANQVLDVLNDYCSVPESYLIGNELKNFDGLWINHINVVDYDENYLKEQGIEYFRKKLEGGLKYAIKIKNQPEEIISIDAIVDRNILKRKESSACEPWPEDKIVFVSAEELRAHNISSITQVENENGEKYYKIVDLSGITKYHSYRRLVKDGLAKEIIPEPSQKFDKIWPEDNCVYASDEFLEEKGIKDITPIERDGQHLYMVSYSNGKDAKILNAKTMMLLGYLEMKKGK